MTIAVMRENAGRMLRAATSVVVAGMLSGAPMAGIAAEPPAGSLAAQIKALPNEDNAKDPKALIARIESLLARARAAKGIPALDLAAARHTLAGAYFYDEQPDKAFAELEGALADMRATRLDGAPMYVDMLADFGTMLNNAGREEDARKVLQDVLAIRERTVGKDGFAYGQTLFKLANIDFRMGRYVEAEKGVAEAVRIVRAKGDTDPRSVAIYWMSWASVLNETGQNERGLVESQNAARWSEEKLGADHLVTAATLQSLGANLNNAGRFAEAEPVLRRSLEINRKIAGEKPESAYALNSIGLAAEMQGKLADAKALYLEAYRVSVASPPRPHMPGEFLLNAANAVESLGDADEAMRLRQRALAELEAAVGKEHPSHARAGTNLALSLLAKGDAAAALPLLEAADAILAKERGPAHVQRVQAGVLLGMARYRSGDASGYARAAEAVAAAREDLLEQVTSTAQTLSNARMQSANFVDFAQLALEAGHRDAAFDALQLARLGDLDIAGAGLHARADARHREVAPLIRDAQDAGKRLATLRAQRSKLVAAGNLAELQALDAKIAGDEQAWQAVLAKIDAAWPGYRDVLRPEPEPLQGVQAKLQPSDALVLAARSRTGLLSMLVTRDRVLHADTRLPPGQLAALVRRIRGSIDDALYAPNPGTAPFDVDASRRLHAALLPPALDRAAARARTLYVVGGGELESVPMGLLVAAAPGGAATVAGDALRRQPWLVRRQAVSTPTSLRLLGQGGKAPADHALRFAGIGAPQLAHADSRVAMAEGVSRVLRSGSIDATSLRSLPELPDADAELQRMRAAFGGDALLVTGEGATEAKVRALDLAPYNVIAFATHGLVSGELRGVSEPGLVLTPVSDDPADDGLLTASDVAGLRLDADWVILSACNTAAGENPGAPLYSGLARAFVHAGARALLLSHWQVRDDVASRLSVDAVQGSRKGLGRAEALRQAQLRVIDDRGLAGGGHPALWAPFALVGD